ncbi:MAG: molecular chaperone DnaJ [Bacteroidales bacterium]|nr:molecular chaperone DnaJ [Bacteroidales bacterium]
MAEKRDYYEVLGLQKGASADDIKGAYRKAALKWHPDRWVSGTDAEKKNAEEKFKEASEAYSVLSDPDKKAKYDQYGFAGVEGGAGMDWSQGFGNLNDILNNLFGGAFGGFSGFGGFGGGFDGFGGFGGGQQRTRQNRGRDIRTRVKLTLEEIASGCTKEVTIERNRPCPECNGKGARNSADIRTCPTCNGTGQVQHIANTLFGRSMTYATCPQCQGEGKVVSNPCKNCKGTGVVRGKETIKVEVPAGVESGMQLTLQGEGHSAEHGGINGDLLVIVEEIPHDFLKRDGVNLFYSKVIPVTDAMLGCEISIPCLDGPYRMELEAGTQSGTVIKLRGKGMPSVNGYGRGDLYVKILVWIPRKLSRSEREAVETLREGNAAKVDPSRDDRALFEKESKYF